MPERTGPPTTTDLIRELVRAEREWPGGKVALVLDVPGRGTANIWSHDPDGPASLTELVQAGGQPFGYVRIAPEERLDHEGRWRRVIEISPLQEYADNKEVEKFLFHVARELRAQLFPDQA